MKGGYEEGCEEEMTNGYNGKRDGGVGLLKGWGDGMGDRKSVGVNDGLIESGVGFGERREGGGKRGVS